MSQPQRFRIGTVSADPLRVEGFIALLSDIAELVPMTPTDAVRDPDLTMVLIDATDQLFDLMVAYRRARPGLRLLVFGESTNPRFIGEVVAAGAKGYACSSKPASQTVSRSPCARSNAIFCSDLASLDKPFSPVTEK